MAKTKPNSGASKNRHQKPKSRVEKSKAKLKNLLDSKGISSPIVTPSEQINRALQKAQGRKHKSFRRSAVKKAPVQVKVEPSEKKGKPEEIASPGVIKGNADKSRTNEGAAKDGLPNKGQTKNGTPKKNEEPQKNGNSQKHANTPKSDKVSQKPVNTPKSGKDSEKPVNLKTSQKPKQFNLPQNQPINGGSAKKENIHKQEGTKKQDGMQKHASPQKHAGPQKQVVVQKQGGAHKKDVAQKQVKTQKQESPSKAEEKFVNGVNKSLNNSKDHTIKSKSHHDQPPEQIFDVAKKVSGAAIKVSKATKKISEPVKTNSNQIESRTVPIKLKKQVKRLSDSSVKTNLSQKSILKGIAQAFKKKQKNSFSEEPIETNHIKDKPAKGRTSSGFVVEEIVQEPVVENIAPNQNSTDIQDVNTMCLVPYASGAANHHRSSEDESELSVGSGAEEILSDGRKSFSPISDMDEMILPDVRLKHAQEEYSNSSDGWEDTSDYWDETDASETPLGFLHKAIYGSDADLYNSDDDSSNSDDDSYNSDDDSYNSDEYSHDSEHDSYNESIETDDSCPELLPIDGPNVSDEESSDFSQYSEYSCEHSDCCGFSEGTDQTYQSSNSDRASDDSSDSCPDLVPISLTPSDLPDTSFSDYRFTCEHMDGDSQMCRHSGDSDSSSYSSTEYMDVEEDDESYDETWQPVGSDNLNEDEDMSDASEDDSNVDEDDSNEDEYDSGEEEDYTSIESKFDDEDERFDGEHNTIDDPQYFTTDRPPLIVAPEKTHVWSKIPLDLNQSFNQTLTTLDTSIDRICRRVRLTSRSVNVQLDTTCDELETTNADDSPDSEEESSTNEEAVESEPLAEASDNENEIQEEAQDLDVDMPDEEVPDAVETKSFVQEQNVNLSTKSFASRPRLFNSIHSRKVLLVLKTEFYFHGILQVTLLAGNAKIYGYSLRPNEPVVAYSPRGHSFVSIEPVKFKNGQAESQQSVYLDTVRQILTSMQADFISQDIYAAIECFDPANDVLLLLQPGDGQPHGVNMIQRYMKQVIFPNVLAFNPRNSYYSSEFMLRTKFIMAPRTKLRLSSQWNNLPQEPNTRTIVIGGKGVGKSTFVRYASNAAVQKFGRVLLVDLDIGQPEIFVPQTISATLLTEPILGPGYLQNRTPDRALLFGDINVTVDVRKYLRCVLQLLQFCSSKPEYQNVPWIVNTMGYTRGNGQELIAAILRTFPAFTDVVQIQSQRQLDNFSLIMRANVVNEYRFQSFHAEMDEFVGRPESVAYRMHVFASMTRKFGDKTTDWAMSSKDSRFAIVLANLGAMLKDGCEWITDLEPVCVSLDKLKVIVSGNVSPEQHLRALKGNLVYLCRQPTDNSEIVECLGIGIVRAVDHATNTVYLLPATSDANLTVTNALAVCNTPLPTSLITNHNQRVAGRVPYVYSTDDFIGSKHVVHIGYRPDIQRQT